MADVEGKELRGLEETARFFGVSVPTVRGWINDPDDPCPVEQRGGNGVPYRLDLRAVSDWRRDRDARDAKAREEQAERDNQLKLELLGESVLPEVDGHMTARQRAEALRAELDKTKLAQLRGDLVRVDDVKDGLTEAFALIRQQLRNLPDDLGRQFGWEDNVRTAAITAVDDILSDLSDSLEAIGGDREDDSTA